MRHFKPFLSLCILGLVLGSNWMGAAVHGASTATFVNPPWPMFRHDLLHTGRSPYLGAQKFHVKWSFDTGADGLDSSVAIDANGTIYVQGQMGYLYALDTNGTVKWKFQTFNSFGAYGIQSSPAIDSHGVVYVGSSDGNLYAILPDGVLRWKFLTDGPIESSPAIGNDGTIYVGSNDGNIYAIANNGQLKWKFVTTGPVDSSPAIDYMGNSSGLKATIYVGSGDAKLYAISMSGELKWSFKTGGGILSSPAIGRGGIVYFAGGDGYVYAINRGGNLLWRFLIAPECLPVPLVPSIGSCGGGSSPAIAPGGTIYIGDSSGGDGEGFYAINRNGTLLWHVGGPETLSSPSIGSDGTIYVGMDDPVLAFNPDGTVKWFGVPLNGAHFIFYSSPSIASDGTIYVGGGGVLLAID